VEVRRSRPRPARRVLPRIPSTAALTLALGIAVSGALLLPVLSVAARSSPPPERAATGDGIRTPARASMPAVRGTQTPLGPTPDATPCARVAVIGDSLTDNARWYVADALERAGFVHLIDATHSRRIPEWVPAPFSGVTAARQVRATWGEADCWVVALGSNDLIFGAGDPTAAGPMIESMLAVLTPGARVWWVNVDYHRDPTIGFDFAGATSRFNATLAARAARDDRMAVIDWYSLAEGHPEWFFDPVHVNTNGSRARAEQIADALPR